MAHGSPTAATRTRPWTPRIPTDRVFRAVTSALAVPIPVLVAAVACFLVWDGAPAFRLMGPSFLTRSVWSLGDLYTTGAAARAAQGALAPPGAAYGILPFIVGTALTSLLALCVAVPVGVLCALFLSEWAPPRLRRILGPLVELLAGVPSVVYGLWGLAVVVPWVARSFGPWLSGVLWFLPFFRGPVGTGMGLLSTGLVLGVMVLPLVTATSRDAMRLTPTALREGAVALGLTQWEMVSRIVLPYARPAIFGAAILALGRALGETMAVLMVSGGALSLPQNLYGPIYSMAAMIASQLDSAMTDPTSMALHALAAMALALLAIAVTVTGLARVLLRGMDQGWRSTR